MNPIKIFEMALKLRAYAPERPQWHRISKRTKSLHQMKSLKIKRPIGANGGQGGRKGDR